jgi:homoserine O-acetyltransferase
MGGMTAMGLLLKYPSICEQLLLISTASASRPFSISLRSLQRLMITSDPDWKSGQYTVDDLPLNGMKLARMLGMITYRSAAEWNQRFGRDLVPSSENRDSFFKVDFQVEQYLHNRSNDFVGSFDPNAYLYLSRAIDLFDLEAYGESLADALSGFELDKITIIGVDKDFIFPFDYQLELCNAFQENKIDCKLIQLESVQGHDSFLVDTENFGSAIRTFFT